MTEIETLSENHPHPAISIHWHRHREGFTGRPHSHRHHSILYIVSGQGTCTTDRHGTVPLRADTAVVLAPDQRHWLRDAAGAAMTIFVLYFDRTSLGPAHALLDTLDRGCYQLPEAHAAVMRRSLRDMLHEHKHPTAHRSAILSVLLSDMLLEMFRCDTADPHAPTADSTQRVAAVLDQIAERYYEPQTLPRAAQAAGMTPRRFSTLCKTLTGRTFVQYVNALRLAQACRLLQQSDQTIAAVAFEVGFEELSTFYRAFAQQYGMSPGHYRKHRRTPSPQ